MVEKANQSVENELECNLLVLFGLLGDCRVPLVMQTEVAECGLGCLAMVMSFHGIKPD